MKILAANYVLPITSEPISDGAIVIENDKIIAVGTCGEIQKQFVNVAIEDFGESVIMPSFVNAHSHLELTAFRGFLDDAEHDFFSWLMKLTISREKLSDSDIETSALVGTLEGLRAGITCFADIGRYGFAGFNALKTHGLRGFSFQETDFSPDNSTAETDFAKLAEKISTLKSSETRLVKVGISPHSPYTVSPKLFERITEYALKNEVKLTIHAAESDDEIAFLKHGKGKFAEMFANRNVNLKSPQVSSIQYLHDLGVLHSKPLLAHCVKVDDRDIELISATDTRIAHCPKSNAKFGHGIAPFEKFLDHKIKVGIGSDSVASNNTCDILEESRFASLVARTRYDKMRLITSEEVMNAATFGGAESLGLENQIGSLEAGKQADLIVIKVGNVAQMPIFDIYAAILFATSVREIYLTMCAGEEVFRDGKALKIDETELKFKLKEIARKL